MQISAIKVLLGDLKGGLNKVNTEILKAAGVDANSAFAHRQFGDLMMSFHQHAKQTFADLEVIAPVGTCASAVLHHFLSRLEYLGLSEAFHQPCHEVEGLRYGVECLCLLQQCIADSEQACHHRSSLGLQ